MLQGGRRRLRCDDGRRRPGVRIVGDGSVAFGRRGFGGVLLRIACGLDVCEPYCNNISIYPIEFGQALHAQRFGQRQQSLNLLLEHVHLARVHERQQGDHAAKRGARQHDDRMEGRLQRAKQLREECGTGAEDDTMGAHRAALGRQRHVGEQRLVEQQWK